ncbi:hypothetical protein V496_00935 [Pseudogymnoascus sp. VKM F-4515 (FW-2607)]|nr:hypothetical protein V496_00935 [Pseudogymnoascus sp. VKM F-4515 (FW-2607)]
MTFDDVQNDRTHRYSSSVILPQECADGQHGLPTCSPVDAAEQQILTLKWWDQKLMPKPGPVPVYIISKLLTQLQFNPAERPVRQSYSPGEYRAQFGAEAYKNMMRQIEEKKEIARRFKEGES